MMYGHVAIAVRMSRPNPAAPARFGTSSRRPAVIVGKAMRAPDSLLYRAVSRDRREWCISSEGGVRTGLEENVSLDRDRISLSRGVPALRALELCATYQRPAAPVAGDRPILQLKEAA